MRPISIILFCAIAVVGLLFVLSTATNYWYSKDGVNFGLWKLCGTSPILGINICTSLSAGGELDYITACRAFMIIAVIAQGVMGLAALWRLFRGGKPLLIIVILTGLGATGACIIALAVYTAKRVDQGFALKDLSVGWSYIVGWLGVIGNIFVVVLTAALDRS